MLVKFGVKNYLSFHDTAILSLEANFSGAEIFKENTIYQYVENNKKRFILNSNIIYGANSSGKSNIFEGIKFLKYVLKNGFKLDSMDDYDRKPYPFRFSKDKKSIDFFVESIVDFKNKKYKLFYDIRFSADLSSIIYEKLCRKEVLRTRTSKEELIFERKGQDSIRNDDQISNIIDSVMSSNNKLKPLISVVINNLNRENKNFKANMDTDSYKMLELFYDEIVKKITFSSEKNRISLVMKKMDSEKDFKKELLKELNKFDFAIKDFEITDMTDVVLENLSKQEEDNKIPSIIKNRLSREGIYDVKTVHNVNEQDYNLEFSNESNGTNKFIVQFLSMYECMKNGGLYLSDEFENGFHPLIQRAIIDMFMDSGDKNKSQFVFITHNADLLEKKIFAKEQIKLVEKDRKNQDSHIYNLSQFKDISYNNHNWENMYLEGRFGAIPEVY